MFALFSDREGTKMSFSHTWLEDDDAGFENPLEDAGMGGIAPAKELIVLLLFTGLLPKRSNEDPVLAGLAGNPPNPLLLLLEVLFARTGGSTDAIVGA